MKTYVQPGEILDYTNDTGSVIPVDTPVAVGKRVGVACVDIPAGATESLAVDGVHALPKVSAGAIEQGAEVYLTGSGEVGTTASGNTKAGYAFAAAADGESEVLVKLNA